MQTLSQTSETLLLASSGGDDMDIDFGDVFGGPPKRRSKVNIEATRHSFNEAALRRRDVITRDEKPVFGEEALIRRRFTTDDFFDDIFRVNEKKNDGFGSSLPGSRIISPVRSTSLKDESPTQFSLPAKVKKATDIPTFGSSVTRSLSKKKETSVSPLSRSSSNVDVVDSSNAKLDFDNVFKPDSGHQTEMKVPDYGVAREVGGNGKGRQFHFSIYKWPNKGVPVVIWGSSGLSSMAKDEEETPGDNLRSSPLKKASKDEQIETSTDVLKGQEDKVKPLQSFLDDKDNKEDEEIVAEREVKKGKSKAKNTRSFVEDSRSKKKPQGRRSSLDSPRPEKFSFASSSVATEVGKDGVKGKVMDFVKIFSQGASVGAAAGESLGQSSRWRAQENLETDIGKDGANTKETINIHDQQKKSESSKRRAKEISEIYIDKDSANAKETINIPDQQKKPTQDVPAMDWEKKHSQAKATQKKDSSRESVKINKDSSQGSVKINKGSSRESVKINKDSDRESVKMNKPSGVTEQEEKHEPSTARTIEEDIDEPIHVTFMVEDITQDENKLEETRNDAEEIKNIDAKIRKWSSGKSGNIRSLLSTLQYILWSGSGWKAVPLMDMIEGNAVRKSYQRALLILHPDKLQQKGASDNQKYMAEKVFELLQEAWDHFNTLGPV